MNARDMTAQLKASEKYDAIHFVRDGGDPARFKRRELSATEFTEFLLKRFAESPIDRDPGLIRGAAGYLAGFSVADIAARLGVPADTAQVVLDRARHVRDTLEPALTADEGRVRKDIG